MLEWSHHAAKEQGRVHRPEPSISPDTSSSQFPACSISSLHPFLRRGWGLDFFLPCTSDLQGWVARCLPAEAFRHAAQFLAPTLPSVPLTHPEKHIFLNLGPGIKGRLLPDTVPLWIEPLKPSASHANLRLFSLWLSDSHSHFTHLWFCLLRDKTPHRVAEHQKVTETPTSVAD